MCMQQACICCYCVSNWDLQDRVCSCLLCKWPCYVASTSYSLIRQHVANLGQGHAQPSTLTPTSSALYTLSSMDLSMQQCPLLQAHATNDALAAETLNWACQPRCGPHPRPPLRLPGPAPHCAWLSAALPAHQPQGIRVHWLCATSRLRAGDPVKVLTFRAGHAWKACRANIQNGAPCSTHMTAHCLQHTHTSSTLSDSNQEQRM